MGRHILITSIPSWNQRSGSNTFSTLFERFSSNDLANLYIRPEVPDSLVCSRYFNIREWLVVRSVLKRGVVTGVEVERNNESSVDNDDLQKEQNRDKYFSKNRKRIFLWLRELVWKLGKWRSKELDDFLDDFRPEILVFSIESYPYFNRINEYIIKHCKPQKIIGYLWDDNFTYKQHPNNVFYLIERYFLRKQVRRLVNACTEVLAISPKMKEECDREFGVQSIIMTKPLRNTLVSPYRYGGGIIRLLYTGSLVIGRDKVMKSIARTVGEINNEGIRVHLDIYTNTAVTEEYVNEIRKNIGCKVCGAIPQKQVFKEQENSDILIFCESLANDNNTARLSFSTKITDYLSSRRCIMAIGPDDNSSINYFKEEDAALVCTKEKDIYSMLKSIVDDVTILERYAEKAYMCGCRNHNPNVIEQKLRNIIYS